MTCICSPTHDGEDMEYRLGCPEHRMSTYGQPLTIPPSFTEAQGLAEAEEAALNLLAFADGVEAFIEGWQAAFRWITTGTWQPVRIQGNSKS